VDPQEKKKLRDLFVIKKKKKETHEITDQVLRFGGGDEEDNIKFD